MAKKPDPPPESKVPLDEDAPTNLQIWADARRFAILERARKLGKITLTELQQRKFGKRYPGHGSDESIRGDFDKLFERFPQPVTLTVNQGELKCTPRQAFTNLKYGARDPHKRDIAKFIVEKYLQAPTEEVYLSTGTTVFEVADVLLDAVEQEMVDKRKDNIGRIVTDNLAIVDLFCRRAQESERIRRIEFTILGGTANFDKGDVVLNNENAFAQLRDWTYTTAIVSAKKIDEETGTISSSRQPETKRKLFEGVVSGSVRFSQLIIPVTSEKISGPGAGAPLFTPKAGGAGTGSKKHIIVTDELDITVKDKLEKWYTVRVAERTSPTSTACGSAGTASRSA